MNYLANFRSPLFTKPSFLCLLRSQRHSFASKKIFGGTGRELFLQHKISNSIGFNNLVASRYLHLSASRHMIHPLVRAIMRPLLTGGIFIFGRDFRQGRIWQWLKTNQKPVMGLTAGFFAWTGAYYFHHLKTTPITIFRRFVTLNAQHLVDSKVQDSVFRPKKVLILSKSTRLELERQKHLDFSEEDLKRTLRQRGTDYDQLVESHDVHKKYLNVICSELKKKGIEYRVVQQRGYDKEAIDWAEAIFTAGGDGTFLMGASQIRDKKPLIGINTNPSSSEGHLCLLKKLPDSHFPDALDRLWNGEFSWLWRQRLRVSLSGKNAIDEPTELHDLKNTNQENHWTEQDPQTARSSSGSPTSPADDSFRILPYLALNDIFIGESQSASVSIYELQIDDQEKVEQKSSGLIVCTGTGSTSWYFNVNKLTSQSVTKFLKIMQEKAGQELRLPTDDQGLIDRCIKEFNDELIFSSTDLRMAYTVRDQVSNTTFRPIPSRGFAKRIQVKSRCFDAHLVIDGAMSYVFNDGAKAILEIRPEDALRTVILRE